MLDPYVVAALGAIYVACSVWAVCWQQKGVPPDSVHTQYSALTRASALLPFVSQRKAGILAEHIALFRKHRRRTWTFLAVFIGTPQVYYLCLRVLYT